MPKPILVGYQTVRVSTSYEEVEHGRRLLAEFAAREGYALAGIFVERDANHPCSALVALIETAQRGDISAIAVPTRADLGGLPRVQRLTRERLIRETGVPVVICGDTSMRDADAEPWTRERLTLAVVGVSGEAGEIELKFRRDSLEIWHREHCCAALDRDRLREWLARPTGVLMVDEVRLTAAEDGHVLLTATGIATRALVPSALAQLRQRV
jgi:hypothetical protein